MRACNTHSQSLCCSCCADCARRLAFPLRRLWLAVMLANSSYSFYWDVEQDWDMPWLVQYGAWVQQLQLQQVCDWLNSPLTKAVGPGLSFPSFSACAVLPATWHMSFLAC